MIIEGALSIVVAIIAGYLLPNWGEIFSSFRWARVLITADNTPWLLPEETEMAQYRLVLSAGGHDESKSDLGIIAGAKLACKDWVSHASSIELADISLLGCSWPCTSGSSLLNRSKISCHLS